MGGWGTQRPSRSCREPCERMASRLSGSRRLKALASSRSSRRSQQVIAGLGRRRPDTPHRRLKIISRLECHGGEFEPVMPCRMCEMRCRSVVLLIVARHLINAGRPTLLWIIVRSIVRCCCTTVNERWRGCNAGTVVTGDGRRSSARTPGRRTLTYTARARCTCERGGSPASCVRRWSSVIGGVDRR